MTETDDQDKFCPACDARRPWFEDACPECGTALVPLPDRYAKDPEQALVTVLTAVDPALLPLAKLALDGARIEYTVRHPELTTLLGGREVNTPAGSGDEPWTINVRQSDAARARELVADLETAGASVQTPLETSMEWAETPPPVELFESDTDLTVGHITEEQLEWLSEQLDEDAVRDREFVLDPALISSYEAAGAEPGLVAALRRALGSRREVRLRWALM
ncbi:MAG TPA: zinc ribbon domain-containing protein [Vicinamibacterales bacterium]|nr:zinc ribbon domain-containing protein [Vicinamibacterales bacterium]